MGADVTVFNTNGLVLTGVKNISELRNTLKVTNGPGVYLVSLEKDGVSKIFKAAVE